MRACFFLENYNFYSGGRYSAYFVIAALSELGIEVSVVTKDKKPFYLSNLKLYDLKNIEIVQSPPDKCDFVMSIPMFSTFQADEYAKKHNVPLYIMVFETPNFIEKYRKLTEWDTEWKQFKKVLEGCDKILCNSQLSKKYTVAYAECAEEKATVIYPCYNSKVVDKINVLKINKTDDLVFIGKNLDFKGFRSLYEALRAGCVSGLNINAIGGQKGCRDGWVDVFRDKLKCHLKCYYDIEDEQKFNIIAKSKLLVAPSSFEGFGMTPLEGLVCNTPVMANDLEVYKEYYDNDLYYIATQKDFAPKLAYFSRHPYELPALYKKYREKGNFEEFKNQVKNFIDSPICEKQKTFKKLEQTKIEQKKKQKEVFDKSRVSICIPVLNEEKFIYSCIKQIYDWECTHEIIILEGSTKLYRQANPDMVNVQGLSIDKTSEIIRNFPDPQKKIKFIQQRWEDKLELKKKMWSMATGYYVWLIDADEFYTPEDLTKIAETIKTKPIKQLKIKQRIFGRTLDSIVTGGRFTNNYMERFWERGKNHPNTHHSVKDEDGKTLSSEDAGIICYHYSNLHSKTYLKAKAKFYRLRNEIMYQGKYESHCVYNDGIINAKIGDVLPGGVTIEKYDGEHSEIIKRHLTRIVSENKKLKVAFIFSAYHPTMYSGGQYAVWRYMEALITQGVDVTFFGDRVPIHASKELMPNIKEINLYRAKYNSLEYPELILKEMVKVDPNPDYDFIVGVPSSYTYPAALYGQKYDIPVISFLFECAYSLLTYGGEQHKIYLERVDWKNYEQGLLLCSHLIGVSDSAGMWIKKTYPKLSVPIRTIFPPINSYIAEQVRRKKYTKKNQIMTCGFWMGKKEFGKYLGEITKRLDEKLIPVILSQYPKNHILRPAHLPTISVEQYLKNINPDFKVLSYIPEEEKFIHLMESQFNWNPYFTAGGDYQTKEAGFMGTLGLTFNSPVMIETTGGFSEIIQEGKSWEYRRQSQIEPALDEDLIQKTADKINWLMKNTNYVRFKTKNLKKYIEDNHTLEAIGKKFVALLEEIK